MMDQESFQKLKPELDGSERLIWAGRPKQGLLFRSSDLFLIPFTLLWCGFAIFWEYSVVGEPRAPIFFPVFGGVFVLIGLNMVVGRFFVDALARRKIVYGVSNTRVLIVGGILARTSRSISLKTLGELSLAEHGDGTGTIVFGTVPTGPWGYLGPRGMSMKSQVPQFERIDQARATYNVIREAQKNA